MAARRLVAVLILMLVLSTVAAIFVPAPHRPVGSSSSTSSSTSTTTHETLPAGRVVDATMDAAGRHRKTVRLRVGDELRLRVVSPLLPDRVVLEGFGQLEAVGPNSPADFDVFASRPGRFDVRVLDAHGTVGHLVIRPRAEDPAPGG